MTFAPRFIYGDLDLTDAPFMVEFGLDLGNAQAVTAVIDSLLTDGELISGERDSNREISLTVLVEGSDLAALADAEALLVAQARKQRNTLTVEPGDDIGPTTVFETFRAQVEWQRDDDFERSNLRRFVLTIPALPHSRSLEPVVDDADTPPSDGGTLLYNCESTAGWSQTQTPFGIGPIGTEYVVDGTYFTEGAGSIRSKPYYGYTEYGFPTAYFAFADRVTGLSLDTGTGGYMAVSIRASHGDPLTTSGGIWMTSVENGEQAVSFINTGRDAEGFVRFVWPVDAALTVTGLRFQLGLTYPRASQTDNGTNVYMYYDDVRLLASATTDKQIIKQLDVQGSARTTGSLLVASPADEVALGKVLVITAPTDALPAGYTPDARRWVTSGSTTADSDAPSGSYFSPNGAFGVGGPVFDVPASAFTPGAYVAVLVARIDSFTASFGVRAQLLVGGLGVGGYQTETLNADGQVLNEYTFFTLGVLNLPPVPVLSPDSDVRVRFEFSGAGAGSTRIDNLYLIPAWSVGGRPVADFSIIDCGSGTVAVGGPSSHLWIDSPSASQPQGGYWRGPDASKQLAVSAWPDATKPGLHVFEPGGLTAFVVSTEAQGPRVELTYYPAWHGSAAI